MTLTFDPDGCFCQEQAAPAVPTTLSADSGPWRRDPFISGRAKNSAIPVTAKTAPVKNRPVLPQHNNVDQELQLQGIIQSEHSYHALINGRTVKVGDSIAGVTVKNISRFQVTVSNRRKELLIYDVYQGRINRGKP